MSSISIFWSGLRLPVVNWSKHTGRLKGTKIFRGTRTKSARAYPKTSAGKSRSGLGQPKSSQGINCATTSLCVYKARDTDTTELHRWTFKLMNVPDLSPTQEDSVRIIVSSSNLLRTVDVLDYPTLESGFIYIQKQKSDLQDTAASVVHTIESKGESDVSIFTYYAPNVSEQLETDSRRLQQLMYNLLGNAAKFNGKWGVVEFSLTMQTLSSRETEEGRRKKSRRR